MAASRTSTFANVTALGVQVQALEGDVRELKDSVLGLDGKIDNAVSSLAQEFRTAVGGLSTQLHERQRTPWLIVFAGVSAVITVLGLFGSQALSPLQADIKQIKDQLVPRVEHDYRDHVMNDRFAAIDAELARIHQERYDEQRERINLLRDQLRQERERRMQ